MSQNVPLPAIQEGLRSRQLRSLSKEMGVSPKQLRVIVELLSGRTLTGAAREAGVDRRTVCRWREDPAFVAAYGQLEYEMVGSTKQSIRALASDAVAALRKLVTDDATPASVRLEAVRDVLGHALEEPSTPATPEGAETQLRARRIATGAGGSAKPLVR